MTTSLQSIAQSPTEDAFVQSTYAFYDRARALGDLVHWDDYGTVHAFDSATVNQLLRDRSWGRAFSPERSGLTDPHLADFARLEAFSLLALEPPEHTRIRKILTRAFTSRAINALRPFIEATANALLDQAESCSDHSRPYELVGHYAEQLPVLTIAHLLGIPQQMADRMLSWSHDMVAVYQARRDIGIEHRANRAARAFAAYINDILDRQQGTGADTLIGRLLQPDQRGEKLARDEAIATIILLLNAGHEATASAIGNGVNVLLESGLEIMPLLAPDQIAATVEEILRFDPPLHIFERIAMRDTTAAGHEFPEGSTIGLVLASANRDPLIYGNPDHFDPYRDPLPHTSFGAGLHFCIGAPLARLELAIALTTLFRRFPDLSIATPPRYANRYHF
ncbi:MAG: cytochrome P450, partial [Rhodobacteraceae bacterium]|nr:cytochrome P450 [Paracoccaceae bacterium]